MKKYKLLLTGRNNIIIDEFFYHMSDTFEALSTSTRFDDMVGHINLYRPDIFVYCLNDETREDLVKIKELDRMITREDIQTVIIGSEEDCEQFQKSADYMADLVLVKPITVHGIRDKILGHMKVVERKREESRLLQEQQEKEQQVREQQLKEQQLKEQRLKKQQVRKHVLIVDDDPVMLKVIKENLCDKYDVATAISGKIARKFLETRKTNLILLDYEMPVEDGPEVLKKIRENKELENIPVLFLTGITQRDKIQQALVLRPQGYLLKPIDRDKLIETIEKFIG